MDDCSALERLSQVIIQGLTAGKIVEIDGLGVFFPDPAHGFRFEPPAAPQVFIAYVSEDAAIAEQLSEAVEAAGFSPWIDFRRLLPGQNWPRALEHAIETSDFFIACFSSNSVNNKGGFQAEIRYALDCARRVPLDEIFVVPLRADDCRVPRSIQRELQYIDLFPDWQRGIRRLITMMRREVGRRNKRRESNARRGSLES